MSSGVSVGSGGSSVRRVSSFGAGVDDLIPVVRNNSFGGSGPVQRRGSFHHNFDDDYYYDDYETGLSTGGGSRSGTGGYGGSVFSGERSLGGGSSVHSGGRQSPPCSGSVGGGSASSSRKHRKKKKHSKQQNGYGCGSFLRRSSSLLLQRHHHSQLQHHRRRNGRRGTSSAPFPAPSAFCIVVVIACACLFCAVVIALVVGILVFMISTMATAAPPTANTGAAYQGYAMDVDVNIDPGLGRNNGNGANIGVNIEPPIPQNKNKRLRRGRNSEDANGAEVADPIDSGVNHFTASASTVSEDNEDPQAAGGMLQNIVDDDTHWNQNKDQHKGVAEEAVIRNRNKHHIKDDDDDDVPQELLEQRKRFEKEARDSLRRTTDFFYASSSITTSPSSLVVQPLDEPGSPYAAAWGELPFVLTRRGSFSLSLWIRLDDAIPLESNKEKDKRRRRKKPKKQQLPPPKVRTILSTMSTATCRQYLTPGPNHVSDHLERKPYRMEVDKVEDSNELSIFRETTETSQKWVLTFTYMVSEDGTCGEIKGSIDAEQLTNKRDKKVTLPKDEAPDKDPSVASTEWTQIALTYNKSDGTISLFFNGRSVTTQTTMTLSREQPSQKKKKLISRTAVGQRVMDADQLESNDPSVNSASLDGYMAMMSMWLDATMNENQMQHVYRIGIDERSITRLEDYGLARTPTLLYPLDGQGTEEVLVARSVSMKEVMKQFHGAFFRKVPPLESYVPEGGHRYEEYRSGSFTTKKREEDDSLSRVRRSFIKNAVQHAWDAYKAYAWGDDELKPLSKNGRNNHGGMGTTLIESLDTLWIMDLKDEFWNAKDWVSSQLSFEKVGSVSVFETTVRHLGGLLSAYDLSGENVFLEKADLLGTKLMRAFDDSPSGVPYAMTVLNGTGRPNDLDEIEKRKQTVLADLGTLQVEFRYMAHVTEKKHYAEKTQHVVELLKSLDPKSGLYPLHLRNDEGAPVFDSSSSKISMGTLGGSFYEYLLKAWLQGGRTETMYREMYDRAIDGIADTLIRTSEPGELTYIAEMEDGELVDSMDHSVCFMGGLLALGAYTHPRGLHDQRAQRDLRLGKALTYTCYQMYARTKTGLSSDRVKFVHGGDDFVIPRNSEFYALRPETVESLFILNRLTGDPIYREWGWEIFQSIETFCKTDVGYSVLSNVEDMDPAPSDRMESVFLAETLKYLFLLFDPDSTLNIHEWILNTKAHPIKIPDNAKFKRDKAR